jgi:Raf kinase inhibitor-like YbhB/YbcL family protein
MKLVCSEFPDGKPIPQRFTCDGDDISPRFSWEEAPSESKSFALVIHDPDAPRRDGFTHWVLYDIPASAKEIRENVPKNQERVPGVGVQGRNDAGKIGYMGPCPPSGAHRYFARLYALRKELGLPAGRTRQELESAMKGQIIGEAETVGTYARVRAQTA